MACYGGSKEEKLSPETQRRWAHDLNSLLASPAGRARFKSYLARANLDDDIGALTFWEMCHDAVPDVKKKKKSKYEDDNELLIEKAKAILSYAENHVNLDVGYLQRLHLAVHSQVTEDIERNILEVKTATVVLLNNPHTHFSQHIVTQLQHL